MARIVNSHFIMIGGLGLTLFTILCVIVEDDVLAYSEGLIIFLGVCLFLSYAFPHNLDSVKDSEANKTEKFSFRKMQKKLKSEIQEQYGNDSTDD